MLRVGKLTDYATWIIHCLASHGETPQSAVDIAAKLFLPAPTVSKILKRLTHAGLLNSARGVEGGYALAVNLRETSLVRLIDAMEGQFALTECNVHQGLCAREPVCHLRRNWQTINHRVRKVLEGISVAEMLSPIHDERVNR